MLINTGICVSSGAEMRHTLALQHHADLYVHFYFAVILA